MKNIYVKLILAIIPSIPIYFLGIDFIKDSSINIFGLLSYYYLIITLFISPISFILLSIKYNKYSNILISIRRQLGIITAFFAIIHVTKFYENVVNLYKNFFESSQTIYEFIFTSIYGSQGNIFGMNSLSFWFGIVGIIFMIFLLITSNNYSQSILGSNNWKKVQRLAYPLFIIIIIHIYFVGGWKGIYLYPAILLIILRSYSWFILKVKVNGNINQKNNKFKKYLCPPCGYIYDEELGDEDGGLLPGTKYEDIPDEWTCPICGARKKDFVLIVNSKAKDIKIIKGVISNKIYLTENVIELRVYIKNDLQIYPGQFLNIIIGPSSDQVNRSYSVSSYKDNIISFIIKIKPGGKGGEYLSNIQENDSIDLLGPYGNFILKNTSNKKIFIATGTGLSPIYNMIQSSWREEKVLYFGVQRHKDLFYLKELKKVPNLKIHIFL